MKGRQQRSGPEDARMVATCSAMLDVPHRCVHPGGDQARRDENVLTLTGLLNKFASFETHVERAASTREDQTPTLWHYLMQGDRAAVREHKSPSLGVITRPLDT